MKFQKLNWDGRSAGTGAWVYEGNELKPKYGANTHNTFEFDGEALKPKIGANPSNTFEFDGKKIKPKYGANSATLGRYKFRFKLKQRLRHKQSSYRGHHRASKTVVARGKFGECVKYAQIAFAVFWRTVPVNFTRLKFSALFLETAAN